MDEGVGCMTWRSSEALGVAVKWIPVQVKGVPRSTEPCRTSLGYKLDETRSIGEGMDSRETQRPHPASVLHLPQCQAPDGRVELAQPEAG